MANVVGPIGGGQAPKPAPTPKVGYPKTSTGMMGPVGKLQPGIRKGTKPASMPKPSAGGAVKNSIPKPTTIKPSGQSSGTSTPNRAGGTKSF